MSAGIPAFSKVLTRPALAQEAGPPGGQVGAVGGRAEEELYPAKGLPEGGQLEIRLSATICTSDPDQLEVAHPMRPFDLESWIVGGKGHSQASNAGGPGELQPPILADWAAKRLVTEP